MNSLTTQKEARKVRDFHFCYLCGLDFKETDLKNYDHVPPEAIFDKQDRNFPIKLSIHKNECHEPMNLDDEIIGQLIAQIYGKQPNERNNKLNINVFENEESGKSMASFNERNIEFLIRRWLMGFHAALYHEPLAKSTKFAIQTPFPSGITKNGEFIEDPIKNQHYNFVECIKRNRFAGRLDFIKSNNGKLLYECVWDKLSNGTWSCIFALNLYNWKDLGDINNFQARGCAGLYSPTSGQLPTNASTAAKIEFDIDNNDITDPFGN